MEIMSPENKKTKPTTPTTLYVPNDIMIDILSWVPANSLLRLRWACKYLFHLITRDDDFIIKQFHRSTSSSSTTTTIHPHKLSLLISTPFNPHLHYSYPYTKIFQCYIDYSTTTTTGTGGAMNPILSGIFVDFRILGSCHGLILFTYYFPEQNETILCIWNPCTKEYIYLPKPAPYSFDGYEIDTSFGLGYDHSIQDYKVICNVKSGDESICHIQIYTLRTNSWKHVIDIESFPSVRDNWFVDFIIGNGVFVNGALHFVYDKGASYPGTRRILSLDFEKEMYVEMWNQPECLNDMAKSIQGLTMFEGSLCLTMRTIRTSIEAWVLKKKDYNMNNNQKEYSWSKLYEIPYSCGMIYYLLQPQPLRFTKDGKILLVGRREDREVSLHLFDPDKITIHKVYKLHQMEQTTTTIEEIYTESLVSLNSGTYIDEKGDYMHYLQE